jgi:glutamate-1-semialdehyde 2,1-aminomutase
LYDAIRLSSWIYKRDKIIKFAGCYHGHSDSFQAEVERLHLVHQIVPELQQETQRIRYWRYNDLESVATLIQANKDEIAAIVEL